MKLNFLDEIKDIFLMGIDYFIDLKFIDLLSTI
jgi:hypothetical protein